MPVTLIPVSQQIWKHKYRFQPPGGIAERSVEETWARVARRSGRSGAARQPQSLGAALFRGHGRLRLHPRRPRAGRRRDGARVTLFNCFVMGEIGDDMGSIFANVREAALTLQQGGGIGHDFSTLRPKGAPVRGVGADASGPVSFMDVWDAMCKTIMSAGSRRGAMMGTLRCDHPDIEAFIEAKADPARLRNFNLSVLVTDDFLEAVKADAAWPLMFGGEVYRTVSARGLWHKIMRSAYDYAEPGVIFIDRVNALNNLGYCETIRCHQSLCYRRYLGAHLRRAAAGCQPHRRAPSRPAWMAPIIRAHTAFSAPGSSLRFTWKPLRATSSG